jgi:hypothetical protein
VWDDTLRNLLLIHCVGTCQVPCHTTRTLYLFLCNKNAPLPRGNIILNLKRRITPAESSLIWGCWTLDSALFLHKAQLYPRELEMRKGNREGAEERGYENLCLDSAFRSERYRVLAPVLRVKDNGLVITSTNNSILRSRRITGEFLLFVFPFCSFVQVSLCQQHMSLFANGTGIVFKQGQRVGVKDRYGTVRYVGNTQVNAHVVP